MRDAFEWWSQIWIPALLGAATVGVSVVALWVSHRASVLAGQVEKQRARAAEERAADSARERLQSMAVEEARTAHRWVTETIRAKTWWTFSEIRAQSTAPRSPAEQARVDAEVALEQSLVPGASDLLLITQFDLESRWRFLRSDGAEGTIEHNEADEVQAARVERTFARIRAWGLSPVEEAPRIRLELARGQQDPVEYLMMGHHGPLPEADEPLD